MLKMFITCFHKCINCHERHTYTMTQCTSHSVWYRYVLINLIMCNWHLRPKYVFLSMHIFRGGNLYYIELWLCLIDISFDHISLCLQLMCFQVISMLSRKLKGKWSIRQRRRFHLTPSYYLLFVGIPLSLHWYNVSLIYCLPKWKRSY
jgi:hypothetical protein